MGDVCIMCKGEATGAICPTCGPKLTEIMRRSDLEIQAHEILEQLNHRQRRNFYAFADAYQAYGNACGDDLRGRNGSATVLVLVRAGLLEYFEGHGGWKRLRPTAELGMCALGVLVSRADEFQIQLRVHEGLNDELRCHYAVRLGSRILGPLERQPCGEHPDREEHWRWIWPADGSVTDATASVVHGCDHHDHEQHEDP